MRKKAASGVLASLRGSPYGLGQTSVHTGDGWAGENNLRFASSLAAALLESLFAHPAWLFNVVSNLNIRDGYRGQSKFFRRLLGGVSENEHRFEGRGSRDPLTRG